jgi:ribonuclease HI
MKILQERLTTAPLLCKLHYDPAELWGLIVLAVDASLTGWGAVLGQYDDKGRKRVARYESGMWNQAERGYDATKRECRGVLKALQKLRFWLYGVHFILETDANTLVAQLNRAATDLPGALVTRWLAWIRLFDFEVRHVKGRKHTAADGLSRRPQSDLDSEDDLDIDEFIALELDAVGIRPVGGGVEEVKPRDTECEAEPDLLEPDFALEPYFSGRPERGNFQISPTPSSLRFQALRINDFPGHMTHESRIPYSIILVF